MNIDLLENILENAIPVFLIIIALSSAFIFFSFIMGGYQRFYDKEKLSETIKKDKEIVKSSTPVGDWGGK